MLPISIFNVVSDHKAVKKGSLIYLYRDFFFSFIGQHKLPWGQKILVKILCMYIYVSVLQSISVGLSCFCFCFFFKHEYMRHNVWGAHVTGWDSAVTAEGVISLPSMPLIGVELVLLLQYLEVVMSDLLSLLATFLSSLSTAVPEGKGRVYIVTLGSKIKEVPLPTQGPRANHLP